jgi:hypothetical protein
LVLLLLLALDPVSLPPEVPLEEDGLLELGLLELALPLEGWSLLELEPLDEGELGVLEDDELPLLSFLARLPLDEPDGLGEDDAMPEEPDEPDDPCERRESLPRSQADSPNVVAKAAATAVRKNRLCTMSTIS